MTSSPRSKRVTSMAEKKPTIGRPRKFPADMSERFNVRCTAADLEAWTTRAAEESFGSVAAWMRKVCNDAVKKPARK